MTIINWFKPENLHPGPDHLCLIRYRNFDGRLVISGRLWYWDASLNGWIIATTPRPASMPDDEIYDWSYAEAQE